MIDTTSAESELRVEQIQSKLHSPGGSSHLGMANSLPVDGMAGCHRCAFVWRPRRTSPARCPRCKSSLWDVPKLKPVTRGDGLGVQEIVQPRRAALFRIIKLHHASNPRVFGSVARNEATPTSDLDLLVDFDPEATVFDQVGLIQDLTSLFRRRVEVAQPEGIHWLIRPQVLFEAVPA